jgi:NTP pyrophosphatase (non-canonical NTP hydrolase)
MPIYRKMKGELDELREELELHGVQQTIHSIQLMPSVKRAVAKECADVAICLFRFCGALGIDLLEEVEAKQTINETRQWTSHGDGTGQHIKNT